MKAVMTDKEHAEKVRKIKYDILMMDYNEAYHRCLYGPDKDKKINRERLNVLRRKWFNF
jgi:hypothetical protein